MNTPAHMIFGLAAFGRPDSRAITTAAVADAIIPDLSLYLLSFWHLWWLGTPAEVVFNQLYFSEGWQRIVRVDNSIPLWTLALILGIMLRKSVVIALAGAALLHLGLDFPFHNDDARAHFWPFTDWKFFSPVSYWDSRFYGHIVGPVEVATALICAVFLWRRFVGWKMRAFIAVLAILELAPVIAWTLMFGGGGA